jgi:hypothetical protein
VQVLDRAFDHAALTAVAGLRADQPRLLGRHARDLVVEADAAQVRHGSVQALRGALVLLVAPDRDAGLGETGNEQEGNENEDESKSS